MKVCSFLCSLLAGLAALLVAILLILEWTATDASLYDRIQADLDVYESVGVSRAEIRQVDADMADYLKGRTESLDREVTMFGEVRPFFNERERAHMEDVRALFTLERTVRNGSLIAAAWLIVLTLALNRGGRLWVLSDGLGLAALLIAVTTGALVIWGAIDFNAPFTLFHQLLFTNDLWLLNPETDALIRLLPERFFVEMAGQIAGRLAWIVPAVAVLWLTGRLAKRRRVA